MLQKLTDIFAMPALIFIGAKKFKSCLWGLCLWNAATYQKYRMCIGNTDYCSMPSTNLVCAAI